MKKLFNKVRDNYRSITFADQADKRMDILSEVLLHEATSKAEALVICGEMADLQVRVHNRDTNGLLVSIGGGMVVGMVAPNLVTAFLGGVSVGVVTKAVVSRMNNKDIHKTASQLATVHDTEVQPQTQS